VKKTPALFLTVPEAGAQVGLKRGASYAAAKRGDIPVIRFGEHKFMVPSDWLDRRKAEAEAEAAEKRSRYAKRNGKTAPGAAS
jgi:hypothetical protein